MVENSHVQPFAQLDLHPGAGQLVGNAFLLN